MSLISLPAFLLRRREDALMPETAAETVAPQADGNVLMRFLTQGGAAVELRRTRFITRWAGGPPFAAPKPHEIGGYQWKCAGCGAYGREGETYQDPHYRQEKEARDEANEHATACRALAKPEA